MKPYTWAEVSDYFAAGNITSLKISDDFTSIHVEVVYYNGKICVTILCNCTDFCYMNFRRESNHEPGTGIVLEAYVHLDSSLLADFYAHKLQGKSGLLLYEKDTIKKLFHLEIIGEVSVDIICPKISFMAKGLPT